MKISQIKLLTWRFNLRPEFQTVFTKIKIKLNLPEQLKAEKQSLETGTSFCIFSYKTQWISLTILKVNCFVGHYLYWKDEMTDFDFRLEQ